VVYPIGSEKSVKVNVRVVVATHKDLAEEVKKRLFREDLFYRIHVIPIRLPPLKERKEDIPYLVDHFLTRICGAGKQPTKSISPAAMQRLMLHHWPGNVRELENTIEYAVVMAGGEVVGEEFILPANAPPSPMAITPPLSVRANAGAPMKALKDARAEFEKSYLIELLERCDGKAAQAAEIAGKYRADFYDLLKKHGIKIQDYKHGE
jgi:two-component system response regulator GlrR